MKRSLLNAAGSLALFVAALLAHQRLLGASPIVWIDTVNDEDEVRRCLAEDSCTLSGLAAAVPGQAGSVAWLELRTLAAWLGMGLDGAHRAIQILDAIAVVLVFRLTARLANPFAAAAAALLFVAGADSLVRVTALHNSSLLFFLGAAFVVATSAVVARPGIVSVALAALLGAIMANVYLACIIAGASVVWASLTAPRRRFPLALFGAALFGLAAYAIAPPMWLANLTSLLAHGAPSSGRPTALPAEARAMLYWALFGVVAWAASLPIRATEFKRYRRRAQGALAVLVPLVAVFLAAPGLGLSPEAKYLFHAKAAVAVAAALPIGIAIAGLLRRLVPSRLLDGVECCVPFVLAAVIAAPGTFGFSAGTAADDERVPTLDDLASLARIAGTERGFEAALDPGRLRTPHGVALLRALAQVNASRAVQAAPAGEASALFLVVDEADLPHPLPAAWRVVSRRGHAATLLIATRTRLDWSRLVVCTRASDGAPERCEESGWRHEEAPWTFVPHLPPTGWRGRLEVRFQLRGPMSGIDQRIFMPRMDLVCGGKIASAPQPGRLVGEDGRGATIPAAVSRSRRGAAPSTIAVAWEIGGPDCDVLTYDGLVPFFVDGDAATIQPLEAILRKEER